MHKQDQKVLLCRTHVAETGAKDLDINADCEDHERLRQKLDIDLDHTDFCLSSGVRRSVTCFTKAIPREGDRTSCVGRAFACNASCWR